jgi:hypothetical protein
MEPREWGYRVVVAIVVAVVIVALAAAIPLAGSGDQAPEEPLSAPAFDVNRTGVTPMPATGTVEVAADGDDEVVLIDDDHGNRIDQADVQPLVEAVTRAGGQVRFHDDDDLEDALASADAYVVIDPAQRHSAEEVEAVESFVRDGGRVVMFGEPNRQRVSGGLFTASIVTDESRLTGLSTAFGVTFSATHLYNVGTGNGDNDGNYRHVAVRPTGNLPVENAAMYTVTSVSAPGGEVIMRTAAETREYSTDRVDAFPVMVRSGEARGVLAVGDSTFIRDSRYLVGDNERVLGFVVDFLLNNARDPPDEGGATDGEDDAADGGDGESTPTGPPDGDGTPTPTPPPDNGTTPVPPG